MATRGPLCALCSVPEPTRRPTPLRPDWPRLPALIAACPAEGCHWTWHAASGADVPLQTRLGTLAWRAHWRDDCVANLDRPAQMALAV